MHSWIWYKFHPKNWTSSITLIVIANTFNSNNPIFHYDEEIVEAMNSLEYPWNDMNHSACFLHQDVFTTTNPYIQFFTETKGFIPLRHVFWFKNPIPTLEAFYEGNMANILPIIKVDIYVNLGVTKHIFIGSSCSLE